MYEGGTEMDTRVALIAIIAKTNDCADRINALLHEYRAYIIGRLGLPYREKGINIITVAIDAPEDIINSLAGKIGRIEGVNAKTVYSNELGH
jgi:putative iron-only hydrogenase system regulator